LAAADDDAIFCKSKMMAVEAALPAGPIDEGDKNQQGEIPVAYCPIEQPNEPPN
jgi:hypothetical protein